MTPGQRCAHGSAYHDFGSRTARHKGGSLMREAWCFGRVISGWVARPGGVLFRMGKVAGERYGRFGEWR